MRFATVALSSQSAPANYDKVRLLGLHGCRSIFRRVISPKDFYSERFLFRTGCVLKGCFSERFFFILKGFYSENSELNLSKKKFGEITVRIYNLTGSNYRMQPKFRRIFDIIKIFDPNGFWSQRFLFRISEKWPFGIKTVRIKNRSG